MVVALKRVSGDLLCRRDLIFTLLDADLRPEHRFVPGEQIVERGSDCLDLRAGSSQGGSQIADTRGPKRMAAFRWIHPKAAGPLSAEAV